MMLAGRRFCQPILYLQGDHVWSLSKRYVSEDDGQDFVGYALILGAVRVVAIAVIAVRRGGGAAAR